MKKRIISFILVTMLMFSMMAGTAFAAEPFPEEDLYWLGPAIAIDENGEVVTSPNISEEEIIDIFVSNVEAGNQVFSEEDYTIIKMYMETYMPTCITACQMFWVLSTEHMLILDSDYNVSFLTSTWNLTYNEDHSSVTMGTAYATEPFPEEAYAWIGPAIAIDENGEIVISPCISEEEIIDIFVSNVEEGKLIFSEEDYKTIYLYVNTYMPTCFAEYQWFWVLDGSHIIILDSDYNVSFLTSDWNLTYNEDHSSLTYNSF